MQALIGLQSVVTPATFGHGLMLPPTHATESLFVTPTPIITKATIPVTFVLRTAQLATWVLILFFV